MQKETKMIGIFPCLLNPEKQTVPEHLVGSTIGTRDFVKAMLRFLPEGTVGLFSGETMLPGLMHDLMRCQQNEEGNYQSARVWKIQDIPLALRDYPFAAIHNPSGPWLHQAAYVRSQFAPKLFPATAVVHGFSYQKALWEVFARLLMTQTFACDSIFCTSHAAQEAFRNILDMTEEECRTAGIQLPKRQVRLDILPLGVDTEIFKPRDRTDARRLLGLPLDKTILLYFGRIDHAAKADLAPLIYTLRDLNLKHDDQVVLVVAGAGTEKSIRHLRMVIERNGYEKSVIMRLQPPLLEAPLYYAAADVFVSPVETLQESFGITPIEAMACGLPVVVSDWSGYRETVLHEQTGFHIPTYGARCDSAASLFSPLRAWEQDHLQLSQSVAVDMNAMFNYLDLLIARPDLRARMGQAGREHVLANFDWKVVMERADALWKELNLIAEGLNNDLPRWNIASQSKYLSCYGHFATKLVDGSERVTLTARGFHVKQNPQALASPAAPETGLNAPTLLAFIETIHAGVRTGKCFTAAQACAQFGGARKLSKEHTLAALMWLIKYGYVAFT